MTDKPIKFIKSKDFILQEELGRGACGRTVKLYDEVIDETFVCKKYEPYSEENNELLFKNFLHEIKLLYLANHKNIVRVFNYYIYPEQLTGYILMEYIIGKDIENYLMIFPQKINNIFLQCIEGFNHLEECNILHRDIRPMNIMISDDGILKIIDFGFGKKINTNTDYDKSISLNWWCEPPIDFNQNLYDFKTEVYFVGKLFEKIIREREIETFKYPHILKKMCEPKPDSRIESFNEVKTKINKNRFFDIEFSYAELSSYRDFSEAIFNATSKIDYGCNYYSDPDLVQKKLEDYYHTVMLEEFAPNHSSILMCFLNGPYYYKKNMNFKITILKEFIELFRSCSKDKKNIIITNLCSKFDAIERYSERQAGDDVPF